MNLFDRINANIEGAEGSIITLVTTLIPWLAPALPAYLTYSHLSADLRIPALVALTMALVVEFLGLAAISTAFTAMRHNRQRENKAGARRVSLAFPVGAYVFYIAAILAVNVLLEWPMSTDARQYARIGVIALLTLISAPAFVIAVARQEQHKIASDSQTVIKPATGDSKPVTPVSPVPHDTNMTAEQLAALTGVSVRTIYRRRAKARSNGHKEPIP